MGVLAMTAVQQLPDGSTIEPRVTGRGATVWLTGLPSAGKSTIAASVAERLRGAGRAVEVLDGDVVRASLTRDLGFSRADRDENVRRIGFVARLLAKHGVLVLVPVIAPYAASRDALRDAHAASGTDFVEVYVATPVGVCSERDVKGLYAKQRAGALRNLTGVDDPYEPPAAPELLLPADRQTERESVAALFDFLIRRLSS
jgi:adenylylsulfate kinase